MAPLAVKAMLLAFALQAFARSVPDNVRDFYNNVKSGGTCKGSDVVKGGFYDTEEGKAEFAYCQRGVAGTAMFLKGPGSKFVNMDVDCDGDQTDIDERCYSSEDTQGETTFKSNVEQYGISDLRSDIHPYVVLGNKGNYSPTFDPQSIGIRPLSVVAVVCGDNLIYGVWGDFNGDDGPPLVGEASLSLATACFGQEIGGNNGYDTEDVLYIAFVGDEAVPGDTALWTASSYDEFEASISDLGDSLVANL